MLLMVNFMWVVMEKFDSLVVLLLVCFLMFLWIWFLIFLRGFVEGGMLVYYLNSGY